MVKKNEKSQCNDIELLNSSELDEILSSYSHAKSALDSIKSSFTIFEVISDLYYRENFHSNLIAFFLDPAQNHGYRNLGLDLFIDMINTFLEKSETKIKKLEKENYRNTTVIREEGRIDILIKDDVSKHAIIVENKMNNALDRDRQIPHYCENICSQKYDIDSIVYIPLNDHKTLDTKSWKEEDKKWQRKIVTIPAFSDNRICLIYNWLGEIISMKYIEENVSSSLKQYCNLITKLNSQNIMDDVSFNDLYNFLIIKGNGENLKKANSFVLMMNEFPAYLAKHVYSEFSDKCRPFEKVYLHNKTDVVFSNYTLNGIRYKIDLWCYSDRYNLIFWASTSENDFEVLNKLDIKHIFKDVSGFEGFEDWNGEPDNGIQKSYQITTPIEQIMNPILEALSRLSNQSGQNKT